MTVHKFQTGQRVQLTRGVANQTKAASVRFTIVRQMPGSSSGFLYRIKGDTETHERMVPEAHLEALFTVGVGEG
jgi:hypothetical protein